MLKKFAAVAAAIVALGVAQNAEFQSEKPANACTENYRLSGLLLYRTQNTGCKNAMVQASTLPTPLKLTPPTNKP